MAQEAAWESVESAWGVMGLLAFSTFFRESFLLQPLAVNLINANRAPNEIPIFFVRKTASARGPGQLARQFGMIGIINELALDSRIRRKRLLLINQD